MIDGLFCYQHGKRFPEGTLVIHRELLAAGDGRSPPRHGGYPPGPKKSGVDGRFKQSKKEEPCSQ
jgi:hypothetical protein